MIKKTKKEIEEDTTYCDICTMETGRYSGDACCLCKKDICFDCQVHYESVIDEHVFFCFCLECIKHVQKFQDEVNQLHKRLNEINGMVIELVEEWK